MMTKTAVEAILNLSDEMTKEQQRIFASKIEEEQKVNNIITAMIVNVIANEIISEGSLK